MKLHPVLNHVVRHSKVCAWHVYYAPVLCWMWMHCCVLACMPIDCPLYDIYPTIYCSLSCACKKTPSSCSIFLLPFSPHAVPAQFQSTGLPDIHTPLSQAMQERFHPPQPLSHVHRLPPPPSCSRPQQQPGSPLQSVPTSPTACSSVCAPSSSLSTIVQLRVEWGSLTQCTGQMKYHTHAVNHFNSMPSLCNLLEWMRVSGQLHHYVGTLCWYCPSMLSHFCTSPLTIVCLHLVVALSPPSQFVPYM